MVWDGKERRAMCECSEKIKLNEMHDAIFGNGGGITTGLKWKIESNTEFIDGLKKVFWIIVGTAMLGAMSAIGLLLMTLIRVSHGKLG